MIQSSWPARLALAAGLLLSALLIVWMLLSAPWSRFYSEGQWLLSHSWGQIALLDLYSGFFLAMAVVWRLENRLWIRLSVSLALPALGNPVLALWLIWRWRRLLTMASVRDFG
ncbi:hypothetical protein [Saccharospirillum mangrovi]|uniref:hypothetical protein n=1 Tax=Saccharospirillum mangrovi TaxID=2161747 RepID=UPI000D3BDED4|nr:hypothetical protein [Saccharospirillum mangrovi]